MTPFLNSIKVILQLLELEPGWNSYGAKAIRPDCAAQAIRVLALFVPDEAPAPAAALDIPYEIELDI